MLSVGNIVAHRAGHALCVAKRMAACLRQNSPPGFSVSATRDPVTVLVAADEKHRDGLAEVFGTGTQKRRVRGA